VGRSNPADFESDMTDATPAPGAENSQSIAPPIMRLSVPAVFSSLRTLGMALRLYTQQCYGEMADGKEAHDLRLATQEACTNIIEHSVRENPSARIHFVMEDLKGGLSVQVQDQGPPFDPTNPLANPPSPQDLSEGGYGLFLINTLVDEIHYETYNDWNTLTLIKKWKGTA
jgi:anti-sigma regulatory factor (Ser/Thr protein kinase)